MMNTMHFYLLFAPWIWASLAQNVVAPMIPLPECAQNCLIRIVTASYCQPTDIACICSDTHLQRDIGTCVLQACTPRESLIAKNETNALCHIPVRNKARSVRLTSLGLTILAGLFTTMRFAYKVFYDRLGWDDLSIVGAIATGLPATVIIVSALIPSGLGRDAWDVPADQITDFVRWVYVVEVLYFLQLTAQKLAFLFFFLRLFGQSNLRRLLWITIIFTLTWGIVFTIVGIFQCQPISHFWTAWEGGHTGKCLDSNKIAWINAGISIALDFWMMGIPLRGVMRMHLSWQKKIGACIMFSLGIFVTIVSIVRLLSLVHFANSNNPTWDQAAVVNWSCIEINVGVMCACLPAIRMLMRRVFPGLFASKPKKDDVNLSIGRRDMARRRDEFESVENEATP